MPRIELRGQMWDGPRRMELSTQVEIDDSMLDSLKEFEKGMSCIKAWGYANNIFYSMAKLAGYSGGEYIGFTQIE